MALSFRRDTTVRDTHAKADSRRAGDAKPTAPILHDAPTGENISLFDGDAEGGNKYRESVQAGHRIDPRAQKIFVACVVLVLLYAVALIFPKDVINESLHNGGWNNGYTFSWFLSDLMANVNGVVSIVTGHAGDVASSIMSGTADSSLRGATDMETVFRYLIIALSGAGLALCGAVYQGSFRNALVSPSSMGVMSGASLGMILWLIFYVDDQCSNVPWASNVSSSIQTSAALAQDPLAYLWGMYSYSIYTFIGCAAVAGLVMLSMALSKKNTTSGLMIIIMGQAFGGILAGITTCIRYYITVMAEDSSSGSVAWAAKLDLLNSTAIGSFFRDYSFIDVVAVGIPILLCVLVVLAYNQRLMVLSFGNEEARSMGVDSKRTQLVVVGVCTLLTAIIICFCGRVGFVGFLVPHLARRAVGPNFKYLLPASMAFGAVFVTGAYLVVSVLLGPDYETMVGMFISIFGAAVFLVQTLRGVSRGGGLSDGFGLPR